MNDAVRKIRDFYAMTPGAPIYQKEFGYYVLDRWISEGYLKPRDQVGDYDAYLRQVFGFDENAVQMVAGVGDCEAAFFPAGAGRLYPHLRPRRPGGGHF